MKKSFLFIALLLVLLSVSFSFSVGAAGEEQKKEVITAGGKQLTIVRFDGTRYISLNALCRCLGTTKAVFQNQNGIVSVEVTKGELSAYAVEGQHYITANGRYLYSDSPNLYRNRVLYVPLDSAVKAVGGKIASSTNGNHRLVTNEVSAIASGDDFYAKDEVLWMARIIHAESGNQPLAGKIAVGTVVMNRVDSPKYPNTIYGVIFDKKYGVQFTPAENGTVWCTPSAESVLAAKCVLDGYRTDPDILFFMNEDIAVSTWISDNCDYAFTIADHSFWS